MGELARPEINISSIRVAGLGGLGMIAVVVAMAYQIPAIRTFALVGVAGGLVIGAAVFAYHRLRKPAPPISPCP